MRVDAEGQEIKQIGLHSGQLIKHWARAFRE